MRPLPPLLLSLLLFAAPAHAERLLVSAAASLADAMREVSILWESSGRTPVDLNLAGSNTLAAQIERGAPPDVFISADELTMDRLDRAGLLLPGSRRPLLTNELVVVSARSWPKIDSTRDLARLPEIAMGDPSAVPAGVYARRWLTTAGVWASLESRVIPTENARAALRAAESGAAAAIVYRTDARSSRSVHIIWKPPPGEAPRITYPVAAIRGGNEALKRQFLAFLQGPQARAIFLRHGFGVIDQRR